MSKRFDDSSRYKFCLMCGAPFERKIIKEGDPARLVCTKCDYTYFVDPKIAAVAVFQSNGGIVMARRGIEPALGKWVCPGGFVERGESPSQTCVRETQEEAGVEIEVTDLVNVYSYPESIVIVVVYAARLLNGIPAAGDETLEVGIFPPDKIPWPDLAFPSTRDSLKDYLHQVNGGHPHV